MPVHTMQELLDLIYKWGQDRNLILGSDPKSQFLKLTEELGEVADEVSNFIMWTEHQEDPEVIRARLADGIGDSIVVLTLLAGQYNAKDNQHPLLTIKVSDLEELSPNLFDEIDWNKALNLINDNITTYESNLENKSKYIEEELDNYTLPQIERFGNMLSNWVTSISIILGDLGGNIARNKEVNLQLISIANCLEQLANIAGLDLVECVEYAYLQIKDRKGRMIDGVFVKEEDLKND